MRNPNQNSKWSAHQHLIVKKTPVISTEVDIVEHVAPTIGTNLIITASEEVKADAIVEAEVPKIEVKKITKKVKTEE